jgi:AcrR family transcriptional regulator
MASTRAEQKSATELALRRAAISLMTERGYDATSTDDIARAAGVSPRTFFNYFASKEAVVLLPEHLLADLAGQALRRRPLGEDVAASLAATTIDTAQAVAAMGGPGPQLPLMLATFRLMFHERSLRQIFLDRRAAMEEAIWAILRERGVAAEDLGARAAVTTVVALAYLGLSSWVESDGAEPLVAVVARCLLLAPDPTRFAAGVTTARPVVEPEVEPTTG